MTGLPENGLQTNGARVSDDAATFEAAFQRICEHMPDAILVVDAGGSIERVNGEAEKMFRYDRSELVGLGIEILVPEGLRVRHAERRREYHAQPRTRPMGEQSQLLGRRKDGTEFPVDISLSPFPSAGGALVFAVIRDVTVRRQTEAALRESEQRYRSLVELSPESIFVHSGGTILYVNPAAVKMFGANAPGEVVGRQFLDYLEPHDRERIQRRVESFEREGKKSDFYEEQFVRPDGGELFAELIISAVKYKGVPARQVVLRDVTQRKKAEEALRESEERYRSLVELSPEAIVVHAEGKILYANEAVARLVGAGRPGELVGREFQDFVPQEYKEQVLERRRRLLEGNREIEPLEIVTRSDDGLPLFIEAISAPITHRGRIIVQTILRNVTNQKLAEAELRSSREQLRNLSTYLQTAREEERTSIAREIHDELGQDLTALKLDLSWLEESLADVERPEGKKAYVSKVRSMESLIDATIKTVRKIATQLRPVLLDSLGLIPAMEWQADEFQNRTGIVCRFVARPDDFDLDRERSTAVFRIFQETLTNIARHAEATDVGVTLTKGEQHVVLEVRDNGRGISAPDMAKAHSFGLIGMRERALMFGGDIRIEGEPGEGTVVTVRLPI